MELNQRKRTKASRESCKRREKYRESNVKGRCTLKEVRIILSDIALDIDLIPLHQRHLLKKKPESKKQQLTNSNISKNIHIDANLSPKNDDKISKIKNRSKKELIKSLEKRKREECYEIKCQINIKDIDINKSIPETNTCDKISATRLNVDQQPISNGINSDSKKNSLCEQTFNAEISNITQQITQSMKTTKNNNMGNKSIKIALTRCDANLKVTPPNNTKDRLHFKPVRMEENKSDFKKDTNTKSTNTDFKDTNPLKQKDSTYINYNNHNNKVQVTSNELSTSTQYYGLICNIIKNPSLINGVNKTEYEITKKRKQRNKKRERKAISLNVSKIDLRNKIKKKFKNIETNIPLNQKDARTKLSNKSISLAIDTATFKCDADTKHDILKQSPTKSLIDDKTTNIVQREENKHKFPKKSNNNIDNNTDINDANTKETIIANKSHIMDYQIKLNISDNHNENMQRLKDMNKETIQNKIIQREENKHKFPKKSNNNIDYNTDINDANTKETIIANKSHIMDYQIKLNISDNHNENMQRLKDMNKETIQNKIIQREENKHKFPKKSNNNIDNNTDINDANTKETIIANKSHIMDYQIKLNISDNPNENMQRLKDMNKETIQNKIIHEKSILNDNLLTHIQSRKNNKLENHIKENSCNENILIKNISDIKNTDKTYNANESLISINNKNIRKRKREESETENSYSSNKRIKLNRKSYSRNTLKRYQHEYNKKLSNNDKTVTLQSDIVTKHNNDAKKDLREQLNCKRSNSSCKVETVSQNNNTDANMLFDEKISNNNNALIAINTMKDREICGQTINKILIFNTTSSKEKDHLQISSADNTYVYPPKNLQDITKNIQCIDTVDSNNHESINMQEKCINNSNDEDEDDDCISLFTDETFDINLCENTCLDNEKQVSKSQHSDVPYMMSDQCYDKYLEQNNNEFSKEYANYTGNDITELKKFEKKEIFNKQQEQVLPANHIFTIVKKSSNLSDMGLRKFYGYCFDKLRSDNCSKTSCRFEHNLQKLIDEIYLEQPCAIFKIIDSASFNFKHFSQLMYIKSLTKLDIDQILSIYTKFLSTQMIKKEIIDYIIIEFMNRGISLKSILIHLMTNMGPGENLKDVEYILIRVQMFIKHVLMQHLEQDRRAVETIASPDPIQETSISGTTSAIIYNASSANKTDINKVKERVNQGISSLNNKSYILHPIDDLPDARSVFRDHFWDFYLDLHRIEISLIHEDYDYVIPILQNYMENSNKKSSDSLYYRSCYGRLQKEIERSEFHLANIIRRTGNKYFEKPGV